MPIILARNKPSPTEPGETLLWDQSRLAASWRRGGSHTMLWCGMNTTSVGLGLHSMAQKRLNPCPSRRDTQDKTRWWVCQRSSPQVVSVVGANTAALGWGRGKLGTMPHHHNPELESWVETPQKFHRVGREGKRKISKTLLSTTWAKIGNSYTQGFSRLNSSKGIAHKSQWRILKCKWRPSKSFLHLRRSWNQLMSCFS